MTTEEPTPDAPEPSAPDDRQTTVAELKAMVERFTRERDWGQFHTPKNLGVALVCEAGEFLDHFRFHDDAACWKLLDDPELKREVAHELADCFWALLRLADVCGVDLSASLDEKLRLAARKYPVDQSYGRADKYTRYRPDGDPD